MVSRNRQYAALIAAAAVAASGIYYYVSHSSEPSALQIRGAIGQTVDGSVTTGLYDNARTGAYLLETTLTPSNVRPATFGRVFTLAVDGQIYAQPLYLQGLKVAGSAGLSSSHNVVFVATMHNSLYAFDADTPGMPLWTVNFGPSVPTSTYMTDWGTYADITPENGILGTPVIDPASGTIYAVSATFEKGAYFYRLHAIDCASGAERPNSPVTIQAKVPGTSSDSTDGSLSFDPGQHLQRPALLLSKGVVYVAFGSHGDGEPYHGWLMGYSAANVQQQVSVFTPTPGGDGGAFWQSGRGPATDDAGNIFLVASNGTADMTANFGNSVLKLDPTATKVADYFTPFDVQSLNDTDSDLVAGPIVVPGTNLVVASGKAGILYSMDRTKMGHNSSTDSQIAQRLDTGMPLLFNMVLWNKSDGPVLYTHSANMSMTAFKLSNGKFPATPTASSPDGFPVPFQGMAISANGYTAGTGVLWVLGPTGSPRSPAVLHAYNADGLAEIWNSGMNSGDAVGRYMKFTNPMVAGGKVFVPTGDNQLAVYGAVSNHNTTSVHTPVITGIVNGASYANGPVAPGEVLAILGQYLGPNDMAAGSVGANGSLGTQLAGVQVTFNGVPGPLYAASTGMVSVIVPYEIAGAGKVKIQLTYNGAPAQPQVLSLVDAMPGLFTADSSGSGPGAFVNQDGSTNSPDNPAATGSIVVLSGTGGGTTSPASSTGSVVAGPAALNGQVSVTVGGSDAKVYYAGSTVGSVAGAMDIKIRVPSDVPTGPAAVVVTIGGQSSQETATLSVVSPNVTGSARKMSTGQVGQHFRPKPI